MSKISKKQLNLKWVMVVIILGLADLVFVIRYLLQGQNVALFNPKGFIGREQHGLMIYVAAILLAIAVPAVSLLYFTAWKYRESNTNVTYEPDKRHGKWFNLSAWGIPIAAMLVLASIMWPATHRLEPRRAIAADAKPLTIQVISMRWKWLFLYPDQKIATVNFVQIPINTPVQFELTADDAPMSSFWIPNLGGQLYSMTSHVNRLNLIADTPGDYPGSSAEINGAGFAGMKFTARTSSTEDFNRWVQTVKRSPNILDTGKYESALTPSENNPAAFYSAYQNDLFDKVLAKYTGSGGGHTH